MNWKLRKALGMVWQEGEGAGAAGGGGGGATASGAAAALTGGAGGGEGAGAPLTKPDGVTPVNGGGEKPWYEGFKDPAVKEWITAYKGAYPDAESLASKALNLEKFIGAEKAGRGVVIPKPDAKPEEWQAFNKKVFGVPDTAEGYKLPADMDAKASAALQADPMFAGFRAEAHKMGMPPNQFQGMMKWYQGELAKMGDTAVKAFETQAQQELTTLKDEWKGAEWDKNVEQARRALKAFVPHKDKAELDEAVNKMMGAMGVAGTYKLWAKIGASIGEHGFVGGEGDGGSGGMTPEGARLRIATLKNDKAWGAKFAAGDAEAKAEWNRLNEIAFSQKPA